MFVNHSFKMCILSYEKIMSSNKFQIHFSNLAVLGIVDILFHK